jgi:hypothetical protein
MFSLLSKFAGAARAIGTRPPIDRALFAPCEAFLNGSVFRFPCRYAVGFISPSDIPDETKLRISIHLPKRSSLRFQTNKFEVHAAGQQKPQLGEATLYWAGGAEAVGPTVTHFVENGRIENKTRIEQVYLLRTFSISSLPSKFVLRLPAVEICGISFWIPDHAYQFSRDQDGLSLCNCG